MLKCFNIESNSLFPNFEVIYFSGKNKIVFFFRNKLYKYNDNFIIIDNINFPEKQILIHSVCAEKTIDFNDINLKIYSQSMISIYNSILLVRYVYQNSNKKLIFQKFMIILYKIHELQNFKFLKTLKFNNNIFMFMLMILNFILLQC